MTTRERLAATLLASLALHALVISAPWVPVPQPPAEPRPLVARLAPPPAEPAPKPAARPRPAAKPGPAVPAPVLAARSPAGIPSLQPDSAPVPDPAPAVQDEPSAPQQIALAPDSTTAIVALTLPKRGRITYTLSYGNDRSFVGRAVQSWEAESGGYRLTSEAETAGLVDLFRPQRLRYVSQGRITAQGLVPESFQLSRSRRGQTETAQARFDWSAGSLAYGPAREQKTAALTAGAQDIVSFMYQLALAPPAPGRHRMPITTGSRFETYELEVSGEESIETPLGTLKALPVKQLARAGQESIEVWLAVEYRYLPVRIRHYDREGKPSGEQLVSEIRISEE